MNEYDALLFKLEMHPAQRLPSRTSMEKVVAIYLRELNPSGPVTSFTMSNMLGMIGKTVEPVTVTEK